MSLSASFVKQLATADETRLANGKPSALYTADQVASIDRYAIDTLKIAATTLMKRAGRAAFDSLLAEWPVVQHIHIFCGAGNNGGDGFVMAALAKQRNIDVTVWCLRNPEELVGDALAAYRYAQQEQVDCGLFVLSEWVAASDENIAESTVVVDALLGTGVKDAPNDEYSEAIHAINNSGFPVLAVDIPSGVNPDTGTLSPAAIEADVTVSFVGQKQGLFTGCGRVFSGARYFSDLDIPSQAAHSVPSASQCIDYRQCLAALPEREIDAHKGQCGHVGIIGGDSGVGYGYGGAVIMASHMALRAGAGLVSLATRPEFVAPALMRQPEMMAAGIDNGQSLLPIIERVSGMVVGPGLGRSPWSEQLFYQVISSDKPLVVDADALYLLAQPQFADVPSVKPEARQWVLTPHPGEAATLLGISIEEVQADRFAAAEAIQQRYGGAVILKGAGSLVVTSDQSHWLCDAGSSAMASGGMGDVLSGLLGALLVQGLSPDAAALLGVSLHSMAADIMADRKGVRGLLATDLIDCIQQLLDGKLYGELYEKSNG